MQTLSTQGKSGFDDIIYFLKMRLAEVNIEVECNFYRAFTSCKPYLASFSNPDFVVKASQERILKEYEKMPKGVVFKNVTCDDLEKSALEFLVTYYEICDRLIQYNTISMHGSVLAKDGLAYMFMAPSGVGKSTRTSIWLREYPDSVVINGDKPFIRISETDVIAFGSPWCGKEGWNSNISAPLKAIFFLERARSNLENEIKEIGFGEAFPLLLQQTYFPTEPYKKKQVLQLLRGLENNVKFYHFVSAPTKESIQLAYRVACLR